MVVPLHALLTIATVLLGVTALQAGATALSLKWLMAINVCAGVPLLTGLVFGILGGSPVAQMSAPGLWMAWFDLWPLMLLGLLALAVAALITAVVTTSRHVVRNRHSTWPLLLACALLTPVDIFLALWSTLLMAPDA